jgi:hypothetical protein
MNPFIEELALKCTPAYQQPNFDYEKFAKLVVKECVRGIKSWRDASNEQMDKEEHWKGYRSGCNDAIVEIQTLFGVENES